MTKFDAIKCILLPTKVIKHKCSFVHFTLPTLAKYEFNYRY